MVGWPRSEGPRRADSSRAGAEGVNAAAAPPHPLRVRTASQPLSSPQRARGGWAGEADRVRRPLVAGPGSRRAQGGSGAGRVQGRLDEVKNPEVCGLPVLGRVLSLHRDPCG